MVSHMTNYVKWLVTDSGLCLDKSIDINQITSLLAILQATDFKFKSMDRPRVDDAFDLRSVYRDSLNTTPICDVDYRIFECVSVLELLVSLAIRVDMEIVGEPGNPRPDILFINWIKNLGILVKDDKWSIEKSNQIIKKLSKWMLREYGDDGKGSIFALKSVSFDFSKTDIWGQIYRYYYEK